MSVGSTRAIFVSASAVLTMLACTSDDTPTDPSTNQTAAPAAATAAYRAVDLGALGGTSSIAYAINRTNQIVGEARTASNQTHAFLYSNNNMRDLGTLGGDFSRAFGINDGGQIVGSAELGSGEHHPFVWTNGHMQDLGTLGGGFGEATAINAAGQVVGGSTVTPGTPNHAFLWKNGTMIDLGTLGGDYSYARGISPTGDVVGESRAATGHLHAFLWSKGKMTDLDPKGAKSQAYAVNRAGRIAGNTGGKARMTIWVNGEKRVQGPAVGVSAGFALNATGVVAGVKQASGVEQATIWTKGTPTVLPTLGGGQAVAQAFGINAANEVVGSSGVLPSGGPDHATWWTLK